jgi:hypothetical protein
MCRWVLVILLLVSVPIIHAQDDTTLHYNDPVVLTLPPGETITRSFTALAGDSFEIRLGRLAQYSYLAMLLDPDQNTTPLLPGDDGNVSYTVTSAPHGGTYSLLIVAEDPGGEMVIQILSSDIPPNALTFGQIETSVQTTALRYTLVPPLNSGSTLLTLEALTPPDAPEHYPLPAFSLIHQDTGETILDVKGLYLPQVSVMLPADENFLLTISAATESWPLMITWVPTAQPIMPSPTFAPDPWTPVPTLLGGEQAFPTASRFPTLTPLPSLEPPTAAPTSAVESSYNLNIPLDSTATVSSTLSSSSGDMEDRSFYDVTGMNENAALSGGRAQITITSSCTGTGTEHIMFFSGGMSFSCGQTIVTRETTYDARTGSVVISAAGGAEIDVEWTLYGTAMRIG